MFQRWISLSRKKRPEINRFVKAPRKTKEKQRAYRALHVGLGGHYSARTKTKEMRAKGCRHEKKLKINKIKGLGRKKTMQNV